MGLSGDNYQQILIQLSSRLTTRHGKLTLTPKMSRFSAPLWHFQIDKKYKLLTSYCYNTKDMFCLNISDEYLQWNKSYGGVKNGMLYSENAKIINMR